MSDNSDFVRNAYKALMAADMPAIRELLSDDIVWHTCGWGPLKGDYRGKDAVIELISQFMTMTEGLFHEEVETFLEDGNRVVAILSSRQSKPHPMVGKHVDIWDLRDGKLVEYWGIQADQEAGALAFS
jgi:ketosteroid isomerase-like protein